MSVVDLRVHDLRNIVEARLEPASGFNLIAGSNASGKTSLLEALYLLGRGRSFRSSDLRQLVRHGAAALRVVATVDCDEGRRVVLGLERGPHRTVARVGGQPVRSLAELAMELPVLLLDPSSHQLLEGGPSQRRRFLDWGVFQTGAGYLVAWRRLVRALRHRNAALRQGAADSLVRAWDSEVAAAAETVDRHRRDYLDALAAPLDELGRSLLPGPILSLDYRRGWPAEDSLLDLLASGLEQDRRQGHTRFGPQRADLRVLLSGQRAVERISRGQQKLVAAALVIAQAKIYYARRGRPCVLLVDDLPAELDDANVELLRQALGACDAQLFVTAIKADERTLAGAARAFRMQAGAVCKVL
jgi:DNA replication and repair protein RecF